MNFKALNCEHIKRDSLDIKIEEEAGKEKDGAWQRWRQRRESAH